MITIASIDFDYHHYDERGDVLYLHVGEPTKPPAKALAGKPGHRQPFGCSVAREQDLPLTVRTFYYDSSICGRRDSNPQGHKPTGS